MASMSKEKQQADSAREDEGFATTHWSLVTAARHRSSSDCAEALEVLCKTYWRPLYVYVRRRVANGDEAQDLTQQFFATLLEKNYLTAVDRERGLFRSFLLTSFKHFLANEWRKGRAQKRGGGQQPISMDFTVDGSHDGREPVDHLSPDKLFERQWATTVMEIVLRRLRDEYAKKGKERHFEHLKDFLGGEQASESYAKTAESLRMTPNAAYLAVHRMRRRYQVLLREEISRTVADPGEVDDEIRALFAAFEL